MRSPGMKVGMCICGSDINFTKVGRQQIPDAHKGCAMAHFPGDIGVKKGTYVCLDFNDVFPNSSAIYATASEAFFIQGVLADGDVKPVNKYKVRNFIPVLQERIKGIHSGREKFPRSHLPWLFLYDRQIIRKSDPL